MSKIEPISPAPRADDKAARDRKAEERGAERDPFADLARVAEAPEAPAKPAEAARAKAGPAEKAKAAESTKAESAKAGSAKTEAPKAEAARAGPAKAEAAKPAAKTAPAAKPQESARAPEPAAPKKGRVEPADPKAKAKTDALDALLAPAPARLKRRSYWPALAGFAAMVLVPTAIAAGYWWGVAADRYVSEFRYSVRGAPSANQGSEGGGVLGGSGALVFASDSFVLEDYLASLQAPADLQAVLPLREMLDRDGDDPVRGYDPGLPAEDLLPYWTAAVEPRFDAVTGITTVAVSMFRPEDAQAVGVALVAELDRIVDSLSAKARTEMLDYVNGEHEAAGRRLDEVRAAIEVFRRENLVVSPEEEATIGAGIIGALQNKLADARVELRAVTERTPDSPRIATLRNEIRALEAELAVELERRGGGAEGRRGELPAQLSSFDELQNDYEIARETFVNTLNLKQQAEAFATLGQAELVVFVPPREAMMSTRPQRWLETAKVFGIAFGIWLILRVFLASLRA